MVLACRPYTWPRLVYDNNMRHGGVGAVVADVLRLGYTYTTQSMLIITATTKDTLYIV